MTSKGRAHRERGGAAGPRRTHAAAPGSWPLAVIFVPAVLAQEAPGAPLRPPFFRRRRSRRRAPLLRLPCAVRGRLQADLPSSETADFVLRVTGYLQGRPAAVGDRANLVPNQFFMRRARPMVTATVAKY